MRNLFPGSLSVYKFGLSIAGRKGYIFLARQQHNSAHANLQLSSSKYGNSSQIWILGS
jgi:hypothetical protein